MSDEVREYKDQLDSVLDGLKDDPNDKELLSLRDELRELIDMLEEEENEEEKETEQTQPQDRNAKQSIEKEPADSGFKVGDSVTAKRKDGSIQVAKVTAVTGPPVNPFYTVRFTADDTVDTFKFDQLRKAKAETTQQPPQQQQNQQKPIEKPKAKAPDSAKVGKGYTPSKSQILDNSKAKWKDFQNKGMKMGKGLKRKKIGEGSMFKAPSSGGALGAASSLSSSRTTKRDKHRFEE